jgi:hypothetical protein
MLRGSLPHTPIASSISLMDRWWKKEMNCKVKNNIFHLQDLEDLKKRCIFVPITRNIENLRT